MSLPHLLLVDDSDAILAYERATLLGHYDTSFARDGEEALAVARELRPAAVLLDLSMPRMDGEEVLAALRASPELRDTPVIIVSSERERGEACLAAGADAYVPKPIRAEELRAAVARVLADAHRRARRGSLAIVVLEVGTVYLALPLAAVRNVFHLPETQPLLGGPPFLNEMFEFRGRPVAVLDLARRLSLEHAVRRVERKLVLLMLEDIALGLTADNVFDPIEVPAADVLPSEMLGVGDHKPVADLLDAVVRTANGLLPLVRPAALLSHRHLARLSLLLRNSQPEAEG